MRVAPSIIAANFSKFQEEIYKIEAGGADLLHLDIMDGVFVPNLTFGPLVVEAINAVTDLELDAHLMIVKPENYLKQFIEAGTDWLSFHIEATEKPEDCINYIKKHNVKVGLALNPDTPLIDLEKYLPELDYVLIMMVNPGFYGQKLIASVINKVIETRHWITEHKLQCLIEVDGGINKNNAHLLKDAGADIIVAGAGVFKQDNYKKAIEELRCLKV